MFCIPKRLTRIPNKKIPKSKYKMPIVDQMMVCFELQSFTLTQIICIFCSVVGDNNSADEGGPTNPAKMMKISNKSKKNMAKRPKNRYCVCTITSFKFLLTHFVFSS